MKSIESPYDRLASEYYDLERHPTCANFRYLSSLYLSTELLNSNLGSRIVEVGSGLSVTAEILESKRSLTNLTLTDQSSAMLEHSRKWATLGATLLVADARNLPESLAGTTALVASLADPYNDKKFWLSAKNTLASGGLIFVTMPAFEWASRFRDKPESSISYAEFLTVEGSTHLVPSLIPSLPEQVQMIQAADFTLLRYQAYSLIDLRDACAKVSPKLGLNVSPYIPLVWGFTAMKI